MLKFKLQRVSSDWVLSPGRVSIVCVCLLGLLTSFDAVSQVPACQGGSTPFTFTFTSATFWTWNVDGPSIQSERTPFYIEFVLRSREVEGVSEYGWDARIFPTMSGGTDRAAFVPDVGWLNDQFVRFYQSNVATGINISSDDLMCFTVNFPWHAVPLRWYRASIGGVQEYGGDTEITLNPGGAGWLPGQRTPQGSIDLGECGGLIFEQWTCGQQNAPVDGFSQDGIPLREDGWPVEGGYAPVGYDPKAGVGAGGTLEALGSAVGYVEGEIIGVRVGVAGIDPDPLAPSSGMCDECEAYEEGNWGYTQIVRRDYNVWFTGESSSSGPFASYPELCMIAHGRFHIDGFEGADVGFGPFSGDPPAAIPQTKAMYCEGCGPDRLKNYAFGMPFVASITGWRVVEGTHDVYIDPEFGQWVQMMGYYPSLIHLCENACAIAFNEYDVHAFETGYVLKSFQVGPAWFRCVTESSRSLASPSFGAVGWVEIWTGAQWKRFSVGTALAGNQVTTGTEGYDLCLQWIGGENINCGSTTAATEFFSSPGGEFNQGAAGYGGDNARLENPWITSGAAGSAGSSISYVQMAGAVSAGVQDALARARGILGGGVAPGSVEEGPFEGLTLEELEGFVGSHEGGGDGALEVDLSMIDDAGAAAGGLVSRLMPDISGLSSAMPQTGFLSFPIQLGGTETIDVEFSYLPDEDWDWFRNITRAFSALLITVAFVRGVLYALRILT